MRIDAYEKVTGKAKYADDIKIEGLLFASPVHAKIPSAKLTHIDINSALNVPNVLKVLTHKDVLGSNFHGGIIKDHELFIEDKIKYAGDVIALVIGKTKESARVGAKKLLFDFEEIAGVYDTSISLKPNAPLVHADKASNLASNYFVKRGKPENKWKKCDKIIETEFQTSFIEHAYLETESAIALPKNDGSIEVYIGTQHPFSTRKVIASACNLPLSKVRVIQTTLGGGFGGKDDTISYVGARTAIASLIMNKPVKCTYSRAESMLESYKRHPFKMTWKLGAKKNGKLIAFEANILADSGAYCSTTPFVIWRPTVQCTGPYLIPNVHCETKAVYTNNTFTGAMRGFGTPQQVFACESAMDMMAHELGIDPFEFRKRNFFKKGNKIQTGERLKKHDVNLLKVAETCLEKFNWKEKFKKSSKGIANENGKYYGAGFAVSYRGVSLGAEGKDFASAIVNIQADGSVILQTGVAENGQGLKSAMVMIASKELGIDYSRIQFIDTDTSNVPDSCPTVASRGTIMGGNAVVDAVKNVKKILKPVARKFIGWSFKNYEYKDEKIINKSNLKSVSFNDVIKECYSQRTYPFALGTFKGPSVHWSDLKGKGKAYFTYVYNCQACDVLVDSNTGKVDVLSVTAVHDAGKIINLDQAKGQVYGGVMMGLGFALYENYKHENGIPQITNLASYKLPRSIDTPKIEAIFIEGKDKAGDLGVKSLGEPVNELMGASIANAIFNATGVRFLKLPITRERIKKALGNHET